jgi:hypothetical protein
MKHQLSGSIRAQLDPVADLDLADGPSETKHARDRGSPAMAKCAQRALLTASR